MAWRIITIKSITLTFAIFLQITIKPQNRSKTDDKYPWNYH